MNLHQQTLQPWKPYCMSVRHRPNHCTVSTNTGAQSPLLLKGLHIGLTRESLFEILARNETRFLDRKFSRDSRETHKSKLVARLASRKSHCQKFRSKTHEKRVSLRNFVARIASYESRRKKFHSKARFSWVSQTILVARLASLWNRNFVARLARIIHNLNSWVLREFWV
jgi:hypothetical protein